MVCRLVLALASEKINIGSTYPWMNRKRLRITDIRQIRDKLEIIHHLTTRFATTLDPKRENTPKASRQILLRQLMTAVALEPGVADPRDVRVLLQPPGELERILRMSLAAQTQRLDAEDELLRCEGVQRRPEISQNLHPEADDEGDGAEGVVEFQAVVAVRRLRHLWVALACFWGAPVEFAGVDDNAADGRAMPADPLRGAVDDDVRAVVDGAAVEASRAEGVVDHHHHAGVVRDFDDRLEVGDVVFGVADGFEVDGFGLVVDQLLELLRLVAVHELGRDAESRHEDFELVVGAAVQVGGRDDVVARLAERGNGHKLRRLTGGGGQSGDAAFECCDALLEDVDRRVHDAGVDVAELFEAEQPRAVRRVIEGVGGGGVDGYRARLRCWVWLLTCSIFISAVSYVMTTNPIAHQRATAASRTSVQCLRRPFRQPAL